jgi:hypothetical protein
VTAELDGLFVTGSRGATRLPGLEPLHWLIREVTLPNAATTEMSLEGAALSFEWSFVGFADGRTRLTTNCLGGSKGRYAPPQWSGQKAAMRGHFKTGHMKWPGRSPYLSCFLLIRRVGFGSPAPWPAFQEVPVVEQAIQHDGNCCAVAEQFAPVLHRAVGS